MEFMLLLWDEWDDLLGTCSHLVSTTANELTGISSSASAAVSAAAVWILAALSIR
jgi:hypothetical protein